MTQADDERLFEARLIPIKEIADRLKIEGLKPASHELVGPCPKCGGTDRFAIHPDDGVFNCRACGGGDGIRLVEHVLNCSFREAMDWLVGERQVELTGAEKAERKAAHEAAEQRRQETAARKRADAIRMARALWAEGCIFSGSTAETYLTMRGIEFDTPPPALRFHPNLRYMHMIDGQWTELHRGPAMLAAILAPSGQLIGVHRTWMDLSSPKSKWKVIIEHDGKMLDAKKVLGSKKGGAIRLTRLDKPSVLVMGEGIETTSTAMVARPLPVADYWCGVDLGNMSGRMRKVQGKRYSGLPDLNDENAFLPPPWTKRLIYLMDGDSDPRMTRAKLESGLKRAIAHRADLRAQIVHAGEGVDLNDVLIGELNDQQDG
ncbi:hypothetical protein AAD018_013830 [Aestuariibius insulae]|uniref:DUF7146 domain-containing protein n=1 Tax=Aestuariibius insulae TaxID=2058287 RepID=UPI00345EE9DE